MINNNNKFENYDISILKKNISNLMKEQGVTQSLLAEIIGVQQSRVSKALDLSTSDCFTIQQLVTIAGVFHVSADFLLGIKEENEKPEKETSLSDVCSTLFELNRIYPLSFSECETTKRNTSENDTETQITLKFPCIFFDNKTISDFLTEWRDILAIKSSIKNKLIDIWETDCIVRGANELKKWGFKSDIQHAEELASYTLKCISSCPPSTPIFNTSEELKLLEEYVITGFCFIKFKSEGQQALYKCIKNKEYKLYCEIYKEAFPD